MAKKNRSIKVYGMSGYKYRETPTIMLKGNWLKDFGFDIGNYVSISCENGKLVITPDAEKAAPVKAESEFMEREMKSLQKKFEAKRKSCTCSSWQSGKPSTALQRGCDAMGKIMMIGAMKGGVGKSVTTFNLAYSLQKCGKKVLAVDFDPQSNLTTCFGVEEVDIAIGDLMMSVMDEEELPDKGEYIWTRNEVDFIASSIQLSAVEAKLRLEMGTEKMLSAILEPLRDDYGYILIDTCPSLGALTINAMAAADEVIVTVNPQLLAMMGLQDFLKTMKKLKSRINDRLEVAGILLTMCDARTNLCKTITEQVQETFQGQLKIFNSKIPNTVKVGESVYYSEPLVEYAPGCNACKAYEKLAGEVIAHEG